MTTHKSKQAAAYSANLEMLVHTVLCDNSLQLRHLENFSNENFIHGLAQCVRTEAEEDLRLLIFETFAQYPAIARQLFSFSNAEIRVALSFLASDVIHAILRFVDQHRIALQVLLPLRGQLYTHSVREITDSPATSCWMITRSSRVFKNTVWTPELAPSQDLFSKFLKTWKDCPPAAWWSQYATCFLDQLTNCATTRRALQNLWTALNNGKTVSLVCYCPTDVCHRQLIASYLRLYGVHTHELSPKSNQYHLHTKCQNAVKN